MLKRHNKEIDFVHMPRAFGSCPLTAAGQGYSFLLLEVFGSLRLGSTGPNGLFTYDPHLVKTF